MIYFLPTEIEKGKSKLKFLGEMIVEGQVMQDLENPKAQSKPKPKIPKIPKLKWILPPKGSKFYDRIKEGAELMGYETAEHEEFNLPDRL